MIPVKDTPMARRAATGHLSSPLQFCQCHCGGEFYIHAGRDFHPYFCPYCGSKWQSGVVSQSEMLRQFGGAVEGEV